MTMKNQREQKGLEIAKTNNQIKRIDAQNYIVKSQSNNGEYHVSKDIERSKRFRKKKAVPCEEFPLDGIRNPYRYYDPQNRADGNLTILHFQ
jgi:hypothetical protein